MLPATKNERLLLAIQYGCNLRGVRLPWDAITRALDPLVSEGAVTQHLAKMRQRLINTGVAVPPPLRRGGAAATGGGGRRRNGSGRASTSAGGSPAVAGETPTAGTPATETSTSTPAAAPVQTSAGRARAETQGDDAGSDDEEYNPRKKAKASGGCRGGRRKRRGVGGKNHKKADGGKSKAAENAGSLAQAENDESNEKGKKAGKEKAALGKRKRGRKSMADSDEDDSEESEESEGESVDSEVKSDVEEMTDEGGLNHDSINQEIDGNPDFGTSAADMEASESEDEEPNEAVYDTEQSRVVTLLLPRGYRSARFPLGLTEFADDDDEGVEVQRHNWALADMGIRRRSPAGAIQLPGPPVSPQVIAFAQRNVALLERLIAEQDAQQNQVAQQLTGPQQHMLTQSMMSPFSTQSGLHQNGFRPINSQSTQQQQQQQAFMDDDDMFLPQDRVLAAQSQLAPMQGEDLRRWAMMRGSRMGYHETQEDIRRMEANTAMRERLNLLADNSQSTTQDTPTGLDETVDAVDELDDDDADDDPNDGSLRFQDYLQSRVFDFSGGGSMF